MKIVIGPHSCALTHRKLLIAHSSMHTHIRMCVMAVNNGNPLFDITLFMCHLPEYIAFLTFSDVTAFHTKESSGYQVHSRNI